MNRSMCLLAVLAGLYSGAIVSSCFSGFQMTSVEEIKGQFSENAVQLLGNDVSRSIRDGSITMAIKTLHFLVAKFMQFRYVSPLQSPPLSASYLFWLAFARSVSSMPDHPFS
ncbi:hypothetical protein FNV43_RR25549 [Rhamnella rubrinervis]|uniref:Uncharacterized protein n=1 Tax=Rhamnella rubrinervis TaxID=2594499 RepID=A0A8K0DTC8_9ROSA|nr:hypothetical protein FNV43_RR25549 [Rhamnella rubrinervis]